MEPVPERGVLGTGNAAAGEKTDKTVRRGAAVFYGTAVLSANKPTRGACRRLISTGFSLYCGYSAEVPICFPERHGKRIRQARPPPLHDFETNSQ